VAQKSCSERKASGYFHLHRSTLRYRPKFPSVKKQELDQAIVDLSLEHAELGSDKVGRLVRNRGLRVSSERVRKVRREECLQVPPPKKKQSRRGLSTGSFPKKAARRGHVWTWDFIHDTTIKGGSYRVLSVIDEYTREVHALHVARNIGSGKVQEVMRELIELHGAPGYIRSDNGPEFVAKSLQTWLAETGIKTLYIDPGCPWQNGYVESFHDKFRRECLARELFYTLSEARVVIAAWRSKFNQVRPHRSLGMKTPEEFAFDLAPGGRRTAQPASYATASGLRSGSRLTTRWQPLSINPNPLTLSGP
jgi:transposase InsO family protein